MIRHYNAQTLALFRENELSERKAARVQAHVTKCQLCAGTSASLADVSSALADVQVPAMPEHLADRIMLALASESAARASLSAAGHPAAGQPSAAGQPAAGQPSAAPGEPSQPDGAPAPAHIPGRPDLPERVKGSGRSRRPVFSAPVVLRTLAATAAVAVIAGGGFLLANSGGNVPGGEAGPASAPRPNVPSNSKVPYAGAGTGSGNSEPAAEPIRYDRKGAIATTVAVNSNINYTPRSIAGQIRRIVQSHGVNTSISATPGASPTARPSDYGLPSSSAAPSPTSHETVFAPLAVVPHLGGCLTTLAAGRKVLLADIARYLGKPAMIVVSQSSATAGFFEVAVVELTCSASSPHVIYRTKIPVG